jgi:hypothetical protein
MKLKHSIIFVLGMTLMGLIGCNIKTPEIHGVVLDEETKQPVEGAWVTATLGIKTKTVAGDTRRYLSVEVPHTRTDRAGRFTIPSKRFKKPSFPFGFGTDVESVGVGASTVDDKGGSISLIKFLGKGKAEVTINIKPDHAKDTEGEYFTYLQGLYNFCLTGRFYVEVPPVEGGCDEWELNYAIIKHERFLKRLEEPRSSEQKARYSNTLNQLAYLYEKKDDFKKAITIYRKLMEFEGIGGWFYKSSEHRINGLEKKYKEK